MLDWPVFAPVVPMMGIAYHTGQILCQRALRGQHRPRLPRAQQQASTLETTNRQDGSSMTVVLRLDLTKDLSLAHADDLHYGLLERGSP